MIARQSGVQGGRAPIDDAVRGQHGGVGSRLGLAGPREGEMLGLRDRWVLRVVRRVALGRIGNSCIDALGYGFDPPIGGA
ncbi:MAG: hypothetical protein HOV83_36775 [Catenulispora sp.]|nr:hypothetical protein [Catenulispora sp.]